MKKKVCIKTQHIMFKGEMLEQHTLLSKNRYEVFARIKKLCGAWTKKGKTTIRVLIACGKCDTDFEGFMPEEAIFPRLKCPHCKKINTIPVRTIKKKSPEYESIRQWDEVHTAISDGS